MQISVIGSGSAGTTIGAPVAALGHAGTPTDIDALENTDARDTTQDVDAVFHLAALSISARATPTASPTSSRCATWNWGPISTRSTSQTRSPRSVSRHHSACPLPLR